MDKMRTRKNRNKIGGAAISGAEGCVIIPSLLSVGFLRSTRSATHVTKLFYEKSTYDKEKGNNDTINAFDPTNSFTYVKYDEKPIDFSKLSADEKSICVKNIKNGAPIETLKHLNYVFGGQSLFSCGENRSQISNKKSSDILNSIANLLPHVIAMNQKGLYHNDLNDGNILYNQNNKKAYLIDFSGLTKVSTKHPLCDIMALLNATKTFAFKLDQGTDFPVQLRTLLQEFYTELEPALKRIAANADTPEQQSIAYTTIVSEFNDFCKRYSDTVPYSGGKKTLRHKRHGNMHRLKLVNRKP